MYSTLSPLIRASCDLIDAEARAAGAGPRARAYILATVWHETGYTVEPVEENMRYSASGLRRVWPGRFTTRDAATYAYRPEAIANRAYADRMGNGPEASGDGWRYRGRGYVQITGRDNYRRLGRRLGLPLEADPELALVPEHAARILVVGMMEGLFTGRALSPSCPDFVDARRVVNGTDRAIAIAGHAEAFLEDLPPDPVPAPAADPQAAPAAPCWLSTLLSRVFGGSHA